MRYYIVLYEHARDVCLEDKPCRYIWSCDHRKEHRTEFVPYCGYKHGKVVSTYDSIGKARSQVTRFKKNSVVAKVVSFDTDDLLDVDADEYEQAVDAERKMLAWGTKAQKIRLSRPRM